MAGGATNGVTKQLMEDLIGAIEDLGEAFGGKATVEPPKVEVTVPPVDIPQPNVTVQAPPVEVNVPKADPPQQRPMITGAKVVARDRWGNIAEIKFTYGD